MEFFVAFWDVLGADLVETLNASFVAGFLPFSLRGALITLIFKKGDPLDHKNWRPISLLNVDYKMCARTLAGCLLKVLHRVIHPDQTCWVRGRFIGENVALLRDVVSFTSESGIPAAVFSLDQEKAFDRVDWAFLLRTLAHMGFGPSFVSWIRLLCTNVRRTGRFLGPSTGLPAGGHYISCPWIGGSLTSAGRFHMAFFTPLSVYLVSDITFLHLVFVALRSNPLSISFSRALWPRVASPGFKVFCPVLPLLLRPFR